MRSTLIFCLLSVVALSAAAQQPRYEEKVEVNAVLVDVTVTDRDGHQILGLNKDDFVVKENGVPQKIDSVDYFTNRRLLDSPEQKAAFKVERVRQERYFLFFFDHFLALNDRSAYRSALVRARTAATKFIDHDLLPEDRVAVAGHDVRLKIYSDFTSDRNALKKAVEKAITGDRGITSMPEGAGERSIMKNIDLKKMMEGTGTAYDAMQVLADALRPIPARKVVMLFSPGVWDVDRLASDFKAPENYRFEPMIRALNRANVSVYPINPLEGSHYQTGDDTMTHLAMDTNGEYYPFAVNMLVPLQKIENYNNGYYLLTYYVHKPKDASGYQKIDVSLKNPEFRVKARAGYVF